MALLDKRTVVLKRGPQIATERAANALSDLSFLEWRVVGHKRFRMPPKPMVWEYSLSTADVKALHRDREEGLVATCQRADEVGGFVLYAKLADWTKKPTTRG